MNTRVLKHTYDKRTAQRFDLLLEYLPEILQNPDQIYANKLGQRGTYCFVKECQAELCLSSIEYKEVSGTYRFEVVTFYVVDNEYLRNYELIWERKGDESSS